MIDKLLHRINRKLKKLRLQPIRVYCFHQTSKEFDASTMWECDWMQIDQFKRNILLMKEHYIFISLPEAYDKLRHDVFRRKKYAVLTADDGWASLKNIIPWLVEQEIPITLFVNPAYLDGKHFQARDTEKLLTLKDLNDLVVENPRYITIASHGHTHIDVNTLTMSEFCANVDKAENGLKNLHNKINFYAFTYGRCSAEHLSILKEKNLIPVMADGLKNYSNEGVIHRECLESKKNEVLC